MSITFSRSMRSLNADSFRLSLIGLVIAMTLLAAWAAWFFLARITLYQTGQIVGFTRDGTIVANFSSEARGYLDRGQPAHLRFDGAPEGQVPPIPAIVTGIASTEQEGQIQIEVFALADITPFVRSPGGLKGKVEVETEHLSPATLVMRASGQLLDTPPLSLSPGKRSE